MEDDMLEIERAFKFQLRSKIIDTRSMESVTRHVYVIYDQ